MSEHTAEKDAPWTYEIAEPARPYYDRMTLDAALADIKTTVAEWSYEEDPHGYCHFRSMLVALVEAVEATRVIPPGGRKTFSEYAAERAKNAGADEAAAIKVFDAAYTPFLPPGEGRSG